MTAGPPPPLEDPSGSDPAIRTPRLHPKTEAALRRAWRAAAKDNAAAHRAIFRLPFDAYAAGVHRLWLGGRARLGLPANEASFQQAIPRLHHTDLYLARACDRGDDAAWRAFVSAYEVGLSRLVARHARSSDAERVSTAVIGDLSLPAPSGRERTLLGTYEGEGSMWGWLAAIAVRRAWREKRPRELALQDGDVERSAPKQLGAEPLPDLNEELQAFSTQLRDAWAQLETREKVALVLKFRDGCTQREISRLLRSTPPTMTRIIHQAIAKLRGRLAPTTNARAPSRELWARFEANLASHLEQHGPVEGEEDHA